MSEKKRYHPIALLINFFQAVRTWFFLALILVFNGAIYSLWGKIALGVIVVIILLSTVLSYFSEAYQIFPEKIVVYKGFFFKSETDIPYERIQTIKERQWFFFKPFHVVQLLIETAGGTAAKAEASLPAVNETLVLEIEDYRNRVKKESNIAEVVEAVSSETTDGFSYQITNSQILLFGLTDLSILAAAAAVVSVAGDYIRDEWVDQVVGIYESVVALTWIMIPVLLLLVFFFLSLVSITKNFLQYYNFRVSRGDKTLTIESGLFERRIQKVPISKIQGIKIRQQLLRRIFGLSTVELLLAGGQEDEKNVSKKLYFLPIVANKKLYKTLNKLLPEWGFVEPQIKHVSRNKLWYFWRWVFLIALPQIVIGFYFNMWFGLVGIGFLLLFLLFTRLDAYFQGYAIQSESRMVVQKYSGISRVQTFVERNKLQSYSKKTSIWLTKKKIGHFKFYVKTGSTPEKLGLNYVNSDVISELQEFYLQKRDIGQY